MKTRIEIHKLIDTLVAEMVQYNRKERRKLFHDRKDAILESLRKVIDEKVKEYNETPEVESKGA